MVFFILAAESNKLLKMSLRRIISLTFLLLFSFLTQLEAQVIHKKDERIIIGEITKIDSNYVFIKEITNLNGAAVSIPLSEISYIDFNDQNFNFKKQKKKSTDYIRAKNNISLSLGGTAGVFSINYERTLLESRNFFLSGKLGIGSYISQPNINSHLTANLNMNGSKHYFEIGLGAALGLGQYNKYYRYYTSLPIIGYRILSSSEKFSFRVYGCGFGMFRNNDRLIVPSIGLDFGFSF
jgi:hypothetical protein